MPLNTIFGLHLFWLSALTWAAQSR
jgi:hypothetical protein